MSNTRDAINFFVAYKATTTYTNINGQNKNNNKSPVGSRLTEYI